MRVSLIKVRRNFDRRHLSLMLWIDGLGIGTIVSTLLLVNGWTQCSLGRGLEIGTVVVLGITMKILSTLGFIIFTHTKPDSAKNMLT